MNDLNSEVRSRTLGYISAALGLVAGLAWNEAIIALIDSLFPLSKDTVGMKFIYAALVTIAVVVLVKYLTRIISREENGK